MKRTISAACMTLFLISCTRAGNLQPAEVLKNATDASQTLQSATYNLDASFHGKTTMLAGQLDGSVTVAGQMASAGQQLQFSLNSSIERLDTLNHTTHIALSGDFVIGGERDVYMKLNTLSVVPPSEIVTPELIKHLLDQWWLIPSGTGSSIAPSPMSPDPEMLRMQTSVVSVVKDRGLTGINGHSAYLYDVTIDQEKMREYLTDLYRRNGKTPTEEELAFSNMKAKGMLWIDAETFVVHRIVWDITSGDTENPLQAHIDVTISDHNAPVNIALPTTAAPFPSISH